jgi:phosphoribosyl 1,2-cyclic phosphate phosphodiesterase|tara:strand:- start:2353 stop:3117 length:765 start_codon:yes stop_codon:yes gene_type:complete
MQITLLGTGTSQGVPVIACECEVCISTNPNDKRLRSSVLIEVDGSTIVIDTGPDFRQQILRESISNLDAVLYTHSHKDHVAGLDDVRSFNFKSKKAMDVFCTEDVLLSLKNEFSYIFSEFKYPGIPRINVTLINNSIFYVNRTKIIPIKALHYKLPVLGFRIKNFIYLTDISEISEVEKQKMLDADLIILDSLRKEPHISHLCLEESLLLLQELKPKKAYLTHISHLMGLHDIVNKELPINIKLAHDGLNIKLS